MGGATDENYRCDYAPVALYARMSSDQQAVDISVTARLRALKEYASTNGYIVSREYVNASESVRDADRFT